MARRPFGDRGIAEAYASFCAIWFPRMLWRVIIQRCVYDDTPIYSEVPCPHRRETTMFNLRTDVCSRLSARVPVPQDSFQKRGVATAPGYPEQVQSG